MKPKLILLMLMLILLTSISYSIFDTKYYPTQVIISYNNITTYKTNSTVNNFTYYVNITNNITYYVNTTNNITYYVNTTNNITNYINTTNNITINITYYVNTTNNISNNYTINITALDLYNGTQVNNTCNEIIDNRIYIQAFNETAFISSQSDTGDPCTYMYNSNITLSSTGFSYIYDFCNLVAGSTPWEGTVFSFSPTGNFINTHLTLFNTTINKTVITDIFCFDEICVNQATQLFNQTLFTQCSDGIDNDADNVTDFLDPDCVNSTDITEDNLDAECSNGLDDDDDGWLDTFDCDCSSAEDNTENGHGWEQDCTTLLTLEDFEETQYYVSVGSVNYMLNTESILTTIQDKGSSNVNITWNINPEYFNRFNWLNSTQVNNSCKQIIMEKNLQNATQINITIANFLLNYNNKSTDYANDSLSWALIKWGYNMTPTSTMLDSIYGCEEGKILKRSGSVWECADDDTVSMLTLNNTFAFNLKNSSNIKCYEDTLNTICEYNGTTTGGGGIASYNITNWTADYGRANIGNFTEARSKLIYNNITTQQTIISNLSITGNLSVGLLRISYEGNCGTITLNSTKLILCP